MDNLRETKSNFDIAPFALPNCGPREIRFEEPRDITKVAVIFKSKAPDKIGFSYLRKYWPKVRNETASDLDNPCVYGWIEMDDWFNSGWGKAAIEVSRVDDNKITIAFKGLTEEFSEVKNYNVKFRRTLGVRLHIPKKATIRKVSVFTASPATRSTLRVELDAGRKTPGNKLRFYGYNAVVEKVSAIKGVSVEKNWLQLHKARERIFEVTVKHMEPVHRYCNDEGHLTFVMKNDTFTISLASLDREGPIWFAEQGVYIAYAEDKRHFFDYKSCIKNYQTISQKVLERPEQSFAGAYFGQPRAHAVNYNLGCKHARQRFWLEPNGDIVLHKWNVTSIEGKDTPRFKNKSSGRFFFGLENWRATARFNDPAPVLVYNIHLRRNNLILEEKSFAIPLLSSILEDKVAADDTIVALVRFHFQNLGDSPTTAQLPLSYSQDSNRSYNPLIEGVDEDDYLIPRGYLEKLTAVGNRIMSKWKDEKVLRCTYESTMKPTQRGRGLLLSQKLQPGETCEVILKIPYIAIKSKEELKALDSLDSGRCYQEVIQFWRREGSKGAQLHTPEPHLNALYKAHLSHVQITDSKMPDGSGLINTSVGTSTYGNFSNEACMVIQELDQRGLHEEARQRLSIWVKYQSTSPQPGNFTDYKGMYYGAGGFEAGAYNQHHGWVLWSLCEHYFLTHDDTWFKNITDSVIAGCDWVFRQRRNTMTELPHSRGWEYGFLPAGSLEDVTDFFYWLSTNALTWRGVESAARVLEAIKHPEAKRIRKEADAYRKDLIKGFETMRQHSPLVRLRNGCWVPHYPSRLYCRGRDVGWIREVMEGSIYLLISGLYDLGSKQAKWILDDYQDNRYIKPPFGYHIQDVDLNWFDCGGFSMQPNLLAGLLPYLERDEPEIYIWMFFNAWCVCYREEIDAMVEHPYPVLGYSNSAHFKTSDEANAVMWLRYMYVFTLGELLHFGRAIPRAWLKDGSTIETTGVSTRFGKVGIRYHSQVGKGKIVATVYLPLNQKAGQILVRMRHPEKLRIKSTRVNGKIYTKFDPKKGDVDITGHNGKVTIETNY